MVNVRDIQNLEIWKMRKDTLYVGRSHPWFGTGSDFANPFKLSQCDSREQCVQLYENYIRESPQLISQLDQLRGLELACWCHPKLCHAHILLKLLGEA